MLIEPSGGVFFPNGKLVIAFSRCGGNHFLRFSVVLVLKIRTIGKSNKFGEYAKITSFKYILFDHGKIFKII